MAYIIYVKRVFGKSIFSYRVSLKVRFVLDRYQLKLNLHQNLIEINWLVSKMKYADGRIGMIHPLSKYFMNVGKGNHNKQMNEKWNLLLQKSETRDRWYPRLRSLCCSWCLPYSNETHCPSTPLVCWLHRSKSGGEIQW